ncbi:MAG: riboflavin biosynthesis protein RibF [Deltaproteobacteria bacterium RIFOXYA12_FULL_58_15]|nr:MAG: riboflavin biosynthesis protein RibF [Deltaproteobacteria bacterium RIFOXYA12_FULL_58_15]OGR12358.1 MAG: riboflavin biosynthesis protein RibF [Deltaproteobacteria bacterium RIFOXYB12_FULL_58_9]
MRILTNSRSLNQPIGPFAVALGIFDGVHIGHQALLSKTLALAKAEQIDSLVYTFNPHPAQVLMPSVAPKLLESLEGRLEVLERFGVSAAMVERFDCDFAAISPESFIDDILANTLRARHIVVGAGFKFGAGGRGTTELLQTRGAARGIQTHVLDPIERDGLIVSSTRIRKLVTQGDMQGVSRLLGRPFTLVGVVERGLMRGQKLGFPTANLKANNEMLPSTGVYAGRASGTFGDYATVVNIGYTPTFGDAKALKIEAHLLDFGPSLLYGQLMSLQLLAKIRNEQRFSGADELKAQIARDITAARHIPITMS